MVHGTNTQARQAEPEPWNLERELANLGPQPPLDCGDSFAMQRSLVKRLEWSRAYHALHAQDRLLRAGQHPGPTVMRARGGIEVAAYGDDMGPEHRVSRGDIEVMRVGEGEKRRRITMVAHPLERYVKRREISRDQYKAGTRFRADYFRAQAMPGLISRYSDEPGQIRASAYMPEVYDRSWRYDAAVRAVAVRQAVVLVWVCGEGRSAADYAKERGWTLAHGMGALKLALDSLCDHYGIGGE